MSRASIYRQAAGPEFVMFPKSSSPVWGADAGR